MSKTRSKEEKELAKYIVAKLLPNLSQKRWPQERSMANKLVDKFPDKLLGNLNASNKALDIILVSKRRFRNLLLK